MTGSTLPIGKLPGDLLGPLLALAQRDDASVVLGPGIGRDCAILDLGGETLLALKTDPITFVADEIGWHVVQINANDIATTGAAPRWFLATVLLPQAATTAADAERIVRQIADACHELGITLIGGHTEITTGLDRPIVSGTLIGVVSRDRLIAPTGAQPGDRILLTKCVPIEATAILARDFATRLRPALDAHDLAHAVGFLRDPGISIVRDARLATTHGRVTAMHDPTEGGLALALWELAEASSCILAVDLSRVPIAPVSRRICAALKLDPYATLASGALLLTVAAEDAGAVAQGLSDAAIACADIGAVESGPVGVWYESINGRVLLDRPERDAITRLYDPPK